MSAWRLVFLSVGAIGLPLALLAYTFPEPPRRAPKQADLDDRQGYAKLFRVMRGQPRLFITLFGGFSAAATLMYSMTSWVPTYMGRHFNWSATEIGATVGLVIMSCGFIGHLLVGRIADHYFARGVTDIHFRAYIISAFLGLPAIVIGFTTASTWLFVACLVAIYLLFMPYLVYAIAAAQLITPADLRGRMVALLLLTTSVIGGSLGPVMVATLTERVFGDPKAIGSAIAVTATVAGLLAAIILGAGRTAMQAAIAKSSD